MELTPEVFEKAEFDERRRGYDIDQVETFLEETGTALARLLVQVRKNEERLGQADATLAEADAAIEDARKRADQAERQLRAAETRIVSLEEDMAELRDSAAKAPQQESTAAIDQEIKQATSTLVMAKRTAESAIREAQMQAEAMIEAARSEAEERLAAARSEAADMIVEARRRAEEEFGTRKSELVSQIGDLQSKRDAEQVSLAAIESQLIDRYADLDRLIAMLSELRNSSSLDVGEQVHAHEEVAGDLGNDELLEDQPTEQPEGADDEGQLDYTASHEADGTASQELVTDPEQSNPVANPETYSDAATSATAETTEDAAGVEEAPSEQVDQEPGQDDTKMADVRNTPQGFDVVDLTGEVESVESSNDDSWGPGSWAALEESLDEEDNDEAIEVDLGDNVPVERASSGSSSQATATRARSSTRTAASQQRTRVDISDDELEKTQAVPTAEPAPRDRFLQELDSAVNEAVPYDEDDEAMKAFFEGTDDSKTRRFGWRR